MVVLGITIKFAAKEEIIMGLLAGLYALFGIGGTAYVAGSGIMSFFKKEMSNEEFIEMFDKEQKRREESKRKYMELRSGKPIHRK